MVKFSEYQQAVFNFIEEGQGNAAINAVAGSGKTFTIVEAARRIPSNKSVLFLAFNKSIADELKGKLSAFRNVTCSTLHAHGFKALRNFKLRMDKYKSLKYGDFCLGQSQVLDIDSENNLIYPFKSNCRKLYDLARINLIKVGEEDKLATLAEHHNIQPIADEISVVCASLADAYKIPADGSIDFTDMLTLALSNKRYLDKYDFVFIDECQDLSAAQRELMLASLAKGGRFIAVGDPKQAINGFAGALNNSFQLIASLPNTTTLPLSVNYRCGSDIVSVAQELVPQIVAHEGAIKGEVNHVNDLKKIQLGDMIICRKSAPLVSVCLRLLANGIAANIKGKDMGEGLKNLVVKMKAKNLHSLFIKLDEEKEKLCKEIEKTGHTNPKLSTRYITFADKIECLNIIAERVSSIAELKHKLDMLFIDKTEKDIVTCSTIHKSKGLEADNVFIIVPEKLPLTFKGQKEWEYEQELNLKYVAITRAKKTLNIVDVCEDNIKTIEL